MLREEILEKLCELSVSAVQNRYLLMLIKRWQLRLMYLNMFARCAAFSEFIYYSPNVPHRKNFGNPVAPINFYNIFLIKAVYNALNR